MMSMTYLPLLLELVGLCCGIAVVWLLLGPVVALVLSAAVLGALGLYLESK